MNSADTCPSLKLFLHDFCSLLFPPLLSALKSSSTALPPRPPTPGRPAERTQAHRKDKDHEQPRNHSHRHTHIYNSWTRLVTQQCGRPMKESRGHGRPGLGYTRTPLKNTKTKHAHV